MVGRKREGCREGHIELDFLTRYLSVATRRQHWQRMDAAGLDRIERGESAVQHRGRKGEVAGGRRRIAIVKLHIRGRILSCGNLGCREGRNRETGPSGV